MSETCSIGASMSTTQTMTSTNGGSKSVSCETNSCNGAIFQWMMTGSAVNGHYVNKDDAPSGKVQQCFFACTASQQQQPLCPPDYCGGDDGACQCCTEEWSAEPSSYYPICPTSR
jgi:hypothetical protein